MKKRGRVITGWRQVAVNKTSPSLRKQRPTPAAKKVAPSPAPPAAGPPEPTE